MRILKRNKKKITVGKIFTGMLIGGVFGATLGWLTAPTSGADMRRSIGEKLGNSRRSLQEKINTSKGNVESRARDLVNEVNESASEVKRRAAQRGKEPLPID